MSTTNTYQLRRNCVLYVDHDGQALSASLSLSLSPDHYSTLLLYVLTSPV